VNKSINNYLKNSALVIISTTISLVSAEYIFRYVETYEYNQDFENWNHELFKLLPGSPLEFSLIPNAIRTNTIEETGAKWSYAINSSGFRGPEFSDKGLGSKKIAYLGDSFTFGWGVEQHEVYPSYLEHELETAPYNLKINTFNFGVPGYNTTQEYYQLKSIVANYRPDMVILGFVLNDAEPQMNVIRKPTETYKDVNSWLLAHTKHKINRKIFDKKQVLVPGHVHMEPLTKAFEKRNAKWLEAKKSFFSIVELCKQENIHLLVVIFPTFGSTFDSSYCCKIIHEEVANWGREVNADFIDLLPYFSGTDSKFYMVEGDGHPNAKAFEKSAKILAPIVANYFQ
jgi:lysophospholipase L1-like esterase